MVYYLNKRLFLAITYLEVLCILKYQTHCRFFFQSLIIMLNFVSMKHDRFLLRVTLGFHLN